MVKLHKRYVGVTALAKELGCSKSHLSLVLHGRTKSARICAALDERKIPYKKWRKAK
jgi:DNA-binding Xre family transcriptional regulator